MSRVSSKLRRQSNGYAHWCPACGETHPLPDGWEFDGNLECPTFTPSFKHTGAQRIVTERGDWTGEWKRDANGKPLAGVCHYVLTAGVLNFCNDCTHAMAGKAVPLPDLPAWLQ